MTDHEAWLALTPEDPIDPALPVCDPHHHLWNDSHMWYMVEDLFRDIGGGHNIVSTVFVESESVARPGAPDVSPIDETVMARDATLPEKTASLGKTRIAAGIIGYADLTLGAAVAPVLEAHLAATDRFRGIRQIITWDPGPDVFSPGVPGLFTDPRFLAGYPYLRQYGLTFESFLYHTQLLEFADLAKTFPDDIIVLEHVGGPLGIGPYAGRRDEVLENWKQGIAAVAACPNAYCKLGGLGMPSTGFGWQDLPAAPGSVELAAAFEPYLLWCIEHFGPDRCMFEGNFPVEKEACSYTVLWNAFKRIARDFSASEKASLFHDTAAKVYRL